MTGRGKTAFFPTYLLIWVVILSATAAFADNYTRKLIDNTTYDRLKAKLDNITLDSRAKAKAQEIVDAYLGEEGMKAINERMREISGKMNAYSISDNISAEDMDIAAQAEMIVFISSSIPMDTLKRYAASASDKTVFVLRGTVGSPKTIMPTINFIKDILCDEKMKCREASIIINPELFKTYVVTRVPTIIVHAGGDDYRFVGAMPLSYIAEKAVSLQKER
jgi:type-F conjugative transfer system pilin assembly protein TrbC